MKKWLKIVLIVLALIVGLLLIIRYVGSPIAKKVIEKKSPEWIGRQVEIGSLSINPFTGSLRIKQLSMTDEADTTTFVYWDELYTSISLVRLIGKQVYLRHIHLTDFSINIWSDKERFNFSDLPQRFSSADGTETDNDEPSSWRISLNDIRLHNGNIKYQDKFHAQHWDLENLRLYIPGLQFGREQTDAGLRFNLPDGAGLVTLRGAYNMQDNIYSLIADLEDINLSFVLPIIKEHIAAGGLDGILDAHIVAHGSLDDIMGTIIEGRAGIKDFELRDNDKTTCIQAANVNVKLNRIVPKTMTLNFDSLMFNTITLNITRDSEGNTLTRLMHAADDNEDTETAETSVNTAYTKSTSVPLALIVKNFIIANSEINYTDKTLFSKFTYKLHDIRVNANNLTLNGQNHIILNANLPKGGSMMLNYRGKLDYQTGDARIVAMLRNVQLENLSPWVEYLFAYPVKQGTLSLTSDNIISKGQIDGMQKIDIYELKLGKKQSKSEAEYKNLPLKSAIGLMTDMNGKILIEVPIDGDLNEPKFSFGKLLGRAIGNILLKATAAPFLAMAKAHNISSDNLNQIQINILQPDLSLEQYKKLDLIAQMMHENEDISLKMIQQFNLKSAIEQQAIFNLKKEYYEKSNSNAIGELTLLDLEKILKISSSDQQFRQYIEPLTGKRGNISSKAIDYYGKDVLQNQVLKQAELRNSVLTNYLVKQQKLNRAHINIITDVTENLNNYRGQSRYEIISELNDTE